MSLLPESCFTQKLVGMPLLCVVLWRVSLTVIEFPSVHVVFPANVSEYPPYQPRPLSNNKQQSRAAPQLQPATTHGATPADVETARPAAATTPMLSSVPHMHPDRLVRSAQYGASEREGDVTTSSEAGVVRRWQ